MAEPRLARTIYDHSPVFFQNLISSLYGWQKNRWRYPRRQARRWEAFYRDTAGWDPQRLVDYQLEQMRRTVRYAYHHVPFYRERFDAIPVAPDAVETVDDLAALPYLTKDDIRRAGTRLISDEYDPRKLTVSPTSGSTGMPLKLYNSRDSAIRNFAIRWASCRPGLDRKDSRATFTGLEIVAPTRAKPPFWRMNYAGRQRLYSVFHLSDRYLPYYLEDLAKFRPVWLYGYPSALYVLSRFMLRENWQYPHPIKAVITSSEECLPEHREAIEKAFKTKLWNEYGQGERAGLAFDCECGKLHERPEYALMELVPTGQEEPDGVVHELICTSFINDAWPLIRYRVGDLAVVDPEATCPLGKPGRVIERIYGRTAHVIIAGDGSRISNISVIAKKCRNVKEMQALQREHGAVCLRVIRQVEYDAAQDEPHMIGQFRKKFGDESKMRITVEYVEKIERTRRGKFLMIKSELPPEQR